MNEITEELHRRLDNLPKYDRGIHWELRNRFTGAERLEASGASANLCKWVLDNTEALSAALAAAEEQEQAADGWVMVPAEPTEEMMQKGRWGGITPLDDQRRINMAGIWRAMLAARPSPSGEAVEARRLALDALDDAADMLAQSHPNTAMRCAQASVAIRVLTQKDKADE